MLTKSMDDDYGPGGGGRGEFGVVESDIIDGRVEVGLGDCVSLFFEYS
jgi:hypothetical protein